MAVGGVKNKRCNNMIHCLTDKYFELYTSGPFSFHVTKEENIQIMVNTKHKIG